MSEGIKSGVNWILRKSKSRMRDKVLTIKVLASPGTPSSRQCPRVKNRCKDLFDHLILPDDHFLQLLLHDLSMLMKLFEDIAEVAGLGGQVEILRI